MHGHEFLVVDAEEEAAPWLVAAATALVSCEAAAVLMPAIGCAAIGATCPTKS